MAAGTNEMWNQQNQFKTKTIKQRFYGRAGAKVHDANNAIDSSEGAKLKVTKIKRQQTAGGN